MEDNLISAKKVEQNSFEFLIGVFTISQVLKFTRATNMLIIAYDEDNMPIYNNEIQRKVENSRVQKIADFLINDPEAIFPTNIVLAVPQEMILEYKELENRNTELVLNDKVFNEIDKHVHITIIDGQHRIKGIEIAIERLTTDIKNIEDVLVKGQNPILQKKLNDFRDKLKKLKKIELLVSFFIAPTLEFQAMIFSTINRTQKSVPQSLVYTLFGLTSNDSPQKTALQTVLALNSYESSPFFNRVKLYGWKYEKNQSPPLTQATMVKSIIDLICINLRDAENDRWRSRKELIKNISPSLPFRRFYARDKDNLIEDIMFSYFKAVQSTFSNAQGESYWDLADHTSPTNVLQTTVGYLALLDILVDLIEKIDEDSYDKVEIYTQYLKKAKGLDFTNQQRYPFTSKSRKLLYYDMSIKIWPPVSADDERLIKRDNALNK